MRIVYIGNHRHAHCTEVHVTASLRGLGHTVYPVQENRLPWRTLPRIVSRQRADLLLWTRTWDVDRGAATAALASLRRAGIPTVSFHLDRWWGLDREFMVHEMPFFRTDHVFTADGGRDEAWAAAGVNHHWLPPGVLAAECEPVDPDPDRFPEDVVFVGSYPYPHKEWAPVRRALIEGMREHYGPRFGLWPRERQPLRGKDLAALYATAKVVVGDSCLAGGATHYWSDRVPETLGRGGLLVHPEVVGMSDWYHHHGDLLTYPIGDVDQAIKHVDAMLDDPETARYIAKTGRATVLGRDTYTHRMKSLLATVMA